MRRFFSAFRALRQSGAAATPRSALRQCGKLRSRHCSFLRFTAEALPVPNSTALRQSGGPLSQHFTHPHFTAAWPSHSLPVLLYGRAPLSRHLVFLRFTAVWRSLTARSAALRQSGRAFSRHSALPRSTAAWRPPFPLRPALRLYGGRLRHFCLLTSPLSAALRQSGEPLSRHLTHARFTAEWRLT